MRAPVRAFDRSAFEERVRSRRLRHSLSHALNAQTVLANQ
jgi:hypothetical protein